MSELQRLKSLLPPENESWVFIEAAAAIDPPLITLEEIGRDEVEIQIDLDEWENFAIDHRNLLFWHEVGKIQNDTIPRDGWEMAALAIGLGGAIGELWYRMAYFYYLLLVYQVLQDIDCLLYTSPSPRDGRISRMPSSA